ncbi:translation-associated GTPase [Natrinema mahii]|nr:translation-associated GTPase [Natrinema mahii]
MPLYDDLSVGLCSLIFVLLGRYTSSSLESSGSASSIQPSPKGVLIDEFGGGEQVIVDRDDLAYAINSDIGDGYLHAVNAKSNRDMREDYELERAT